jgi:hypothetical protein
MHVHRGVLAAAGATLVLALTGCGGGGENSGDSETTATEASGGAAPSLDAVLACLKKEGLDAKDQSSSTGEQIGIDYPGGRLGVKFEESPEEAETYASVAETNGETAVVKGSVVITVPADPGAETARPAVEGCVDSPA